MINERDFDLHFVWLTPCREGSRTEKNDKVAFLQKLLIFQLKLIKRDADEGTGQLNNSKSVALVPKLCMSSPMLKIPLGVVWSQVKIWKWDEKGRRLCWDSVRIIFTLILCGLWHIHQSNQSNFLWNTKDHWKAISPRSLERLSALDIFLAEWVNCILELNHRGVAWQIDCKIKC